MTNREFLMAITTLDNAELAEHARLAIEKLDAANEKRKGKLSKKAEENQPLIERIACEILGTEPMTATDVAGILEVSVQKASTLCRTAVAQGKATQLDVKVPKKGKMKAYTKA